MHNHAIADNFSLLSKLFDIHGEDSFKAKSYSSAAFTIEKLPIQLETLSEDKIFAIKGIGQATGKKIVEQLETGRLAVLDEFIRKTPAGIFELLKIKGLGPKKIATVWKELGIESVGELLYACEENRLLLYKGFGAKTQQNIQESIQFLMDCQGSYLYSQIESYADQFSRKLQEEFPSQRFEIVGDLNRHLEVIDKLEWMTDVPLEKLESFFKKEEYETNIENDILFAKGSENIALEFHYALGNAFVFKQFEKNSGKEFFSLWQEKYGLPYDEDLIKEESIFEKKNLPYIPPFLRETTAILDLAENKQLPKVVQYEDIRGIIHTHSDWSDGKDTLESMVKGAIAKNMGYLVISDHSQSAFYAKGLYPERVKMQHELIDELNEKYKPFKIFKSIESDILNDGNLDYTDDVLSTFDLVITSVHSNLKMSEEKAMSRLLKAISNPFTTILGHMTGRLLLSRNGYPVNYEAIIEACAEHNVVIELNAHSRRLDMDWRQIPKAIKKGVLISIDPDAHAVDAFSDIRYGVLAAQKGGLTAEHNLSSFTLDQFEAFLAKQRAKRP